MRLEEVRLVGYERPLSEITLRAGESVTKRFRLLTEEEGATTRRMGDWVGG